MSARKKVIKRTRTGSPRLPGIFGAVVERITELVDEEYYGEDKIRGELLDLQMKREMEEITEEQYLKAEALLMKRLEKAKEKNG